MPATHLTLRPQPAPEAGLKPLLAASLKLWWQNLPMIALTVLPIMLPLYGVMEWAESVKHEGLQLGMTVLMAVLIPWPGAATLYGLAHRWNGQPWPALFKAWGYALKRLPYLFFTLFKVQLWILVGLLMLLLPGWKRMIKSSLAEVVVVMEPTDTPPLERSIALVAQDTPLVTRALLLLLTLVGLEMGLLALVPASWPWGVKTALDSGMLLLELSGIVVWLQVYTQLKGKDGIAPLSGP
jgi:hypothetical protein